MKVYVVAADGDAGGMVYSAVFAKREDAEALAGQKPSYLYVLEEELRDAPFESDWFDLGHPDWDPTPGTIFVQSA